MSPPFLVLKGQTLAVTEAILGLTITNVPRDKWYSALTLQPQTIGRGKNSVIRVPPNHASVSRVHAQVWCDPHGGWIADLRSTFGTTVNGLRIPKNRKTRIWCGDRIKLGQLELLLIDDRNFLTNLLLDDHGPNDSSADTFKAHSAAEASRQRLQERLATLSHAEREVLLWATRGYTSPEAIGTKLHRSPHTVQTQLMNMFRKLEVHSRDELLGLILRYHHDGSTGEAVS